jgi:transcriptional regulator with XRE-family HTH domain
VNPTVRRRRLASELRRLREAAKLTCGDVAARLECSASKISRIETGRVLTSPRDARDLAMIYGVSEEVRDSLVQLARESRQQGWWHTFADSIQPHAAAYVGMESAASENRIYRVTRIPSLLQTADYALAMSAAANVGIRPDTPHRSAELHAERQRQASTRPHILEAVFGEAALRRQVGGAQVMRAQIEHLIAMRCVPGTCVQVLQFSSAPWIPVDLPFGILSFPDPADLDVVCIRYPTGLLWLEDTTEVEMYRRLFSRLQASALSPEESVAFMTSVLRNT